MILNRINNFQDYCKHRDNNTNYEMFNAVEAKIQNQLETQKQLHIEGISWPIQTQSQFLVDKLYSDGKLINFRERLVCEKTGINNRIRGSIHIFEEYFKASINDSIYLTEQCTLLGKWMQNKYTNLCSSEYLVDCSKKKQARMNNWLYPHKLHHQDLTQLTYTDDTFDYILSFDCFEHIPDYKKAFSECFRVLKPGGKMLWSVPFDRNEYKTNVRAEVNSDGSIKHNCEPEYHGNPLSEDGCLSFYTFGWDLLDELKNIGFSDTYALFYWSEKYAYLGGEQILLCAVKLIR